jgi:hypothetical protein
MKWTRRKWGGDWIYLLHVDAVACAAEDKTCSHCFCEAAGLACAC